MDLNKYKWNMPMIQLKNIKGPAIVYIYSPHCGACVARSPRFDEQMKGLEHVYRFNAQKDQQIKELLDFGFDLQHYPTILGIRASGKLYESEISTRSQAENLLQALEKT